MKKVRLAVFGCLGGVLISFQNCSGHMQSYQEISNVQAQGLRSQENDSPGLSESVKQLRTAPSASCAASDLKLAWPLGGTPHVDWNIANYKDEDPTAGI